jgi:hypothetical protein
MQFNKGPFGTAPPAAPEAVLRGAVPKRSKKWIWERSRRVPGDWSPSAGRELKIVAPPALRAAPPPFFHRLPSKAHAEELLRASMADGRNTTGGGRRARWRGSGGGDMLRRSTGGVVDWW